jgi:hypothetical protein
MLMEGFSHCYVITTTPPTTVMARPQQASRPDSNVNTGRLARLHARLFVVADTFRTSLPFGTAAVYAYLFAAERGLV